MADRWLRSLALDIYVDEQAGYGQRCFAMIACENRMEFKQVVMCVAVLTGLQILAEQVLAKEKVSCAARDFMMRRQVKGAQGE
jgi:hypothetical protein